MANTRTLQTVQQEVVKTVSHTIEGIGTEVGEQLQGLVREAKNRHVAVRDASGRLILRIPLIISLVGGISFLLLVPIRRAILITIGALFARIYVSVEENDEMTGTRPANRRQ
jgi:hypothetical protein